jgi:hypothetical protein
MKASIFPFFEELRLSGSEFDSPHTYLKHLAETQTALADAFYMGSRFGRLVDKASFEINENLLEEIIADIMVIVAIKAVVK